jgi:hypothetical protein
MLIPLVPLRASALKHLSINPAHRDRTPILNELERETHARVPRYMAVAQPSARVVEPEGDGEVAVFREYGCVATRRVFELE